MKRLIKVVVIPALFLMILFSGATLAQSDGAEETSNNSLKFTTKEQSNGSISEPNSLHNLIQVSFGLVVVIGIIAGAAWFTKKFGNFQISSKGNMRVVGGLHLGARERVVLIQVGNEQIVLGVAPGRIDKLHIMETLVSDEGHPTDKNRYSFAEKLSMVIKGNKI